MQTKVSNTLEAACASGSKVREIKAALVRRKGGPFELETLHLEAPRVDELLVRIVATGVCQRDAHARDQAYPVPLPAVLGHEGAGVVKRVN
jgi:aryl-alcohol dehydrogenase